MGTANISFKIHHLYIRLLFYFSGLFILALIPCVKKIQQHFRTRDKQLKTGDYQLNNFVPMKLFLTFSETLTALLMKKHVYVCLYFFSQHSSSHAVVWQIACCILCTAHWQTLSFQIISLCHFSARVLTSSSSALRKLKNPAPKALFLLSGVPLCEKSGCAC